MGPYDLLSLSKWGPFHTEPDGVGRFLLSPAQIRLESRILGGTVASPRSYPRLQMELLLVTACVEKFVKVKMEKNHYGC
jgi:hypothetical protein